MFTQLQVKRKSSASWLPPPRNRLPPSSRFFARDSAQALLRVARDVRVGRQVAAHRTLCALRGGRDRVGVVLRVPAAALVVVLPGEHPLALGDRTARLERPGVDEEAVLFADSEVEVLLRQRAPGTRVTDPTGLRDLQLHRQRGELFA